MGEKIRVFLVDDHELVREGLRRMLELEENLEVVGEAASAAETLAQVEALSPDVILMDIKMPNTNGLDATRQLKKKGLRGEVIVLSLYSEYLAQAIEAGAGGYLAKNVKREELASAIQRVFRGEFVLGESVMETPAIAEGALSQLRDMIQGKVSGVARGSPSQDAAATGKPVPRQDVGVRREAGESLPRTAPAAPPEAPRPPEVRQPGAAEPVPEIRRSSEPPKAGGSGGVGAQPPQGETLSPLPGGAPTVARPDTEGEAAAGNGKSVSAQVEDQILQEQPEESPPPPMEGSDIYESEVELVLPPPVEAGRLMAFHRRLKGAGLGDIVRTQASWREGTSFTMVLKRPVALLEILDSMPEVAEVREEPARVSEVRRDSSDDTEDLPNPPRRLRLTLKEPSVPKQISLKLDA